MTTEEKARRYDEALNWMREIYPGLHGATKEDAEHFFPQLAAENKDEWIRTEIIDFIQWAEDRGMTRHDYHQAKRPAVWIAYLEKQKDLNNMIVVSPEVWDNAISDAYENGKKEGEKQKEHQSCPDAPKEKKLGSNFYPSDKDKNLDEIAQDYVDGVKQYNQEPTWDLMQTAVCYGYHLSEEQFEKNRLANCDAVSKEECDRETGFAMEIIEKEHRQPTFNDAINYGMRLQKQKEQKPLTTEETELNSIAFLEQMGYTCIPPRKEQKPVEKQDYSGLNDLERAIHRGFLAAGIENVPVTIIKETAKECLAQMKPAKWGENDENMLNSIINVVCGVGIQSNGGLREKQVSWLKSLPERFNLQPKQEWREVELEFRGEKVKVKRPFFRDDNGRGYSTTEQDEDVAWYALRAWCEKKDISLYDLYPKEEWSDEDEKMLTELLLTIEPSNNYDEMRNWLLLKLKALLLQGSKDSLQTSWKPSEEQMKALCSELPVVKGGGDKVQDILETLYDDLKKLI